MRSNEDADGDTLLSRRWFLSPNYNKIKHEKN